MTGFTDVRDGDPKDMERDILEMQKIGFHLKVRDGKIAIKGTFQKMWDYGKKTTTIKYEPED